mmetsp:Transcript_23064/g.34345  ORF Transcript_23064/g.34345 Transcript_23064/m.34345 type:complete len:350 (+) Transcript_23064:3107-4156(+)|eukprot:CAMPEP_0167765794 /NCGR_PEP_ID=MMETSP0110_2-20121227/14922_1 /TAXON_ID=629695 /ORGANISM="Gymnochlora sp., Strain CCMP2014" /LENGTH=349 /DNA_ID=CAMNT_0007653621 /DNA_START=256 /DNA_END=1305 /DNA_ORIENTATION=-
MAEGLQNGSTGAPVGQMPDVPNEVIEKKKKENTRKVALVRKTLLQENAILMQRQKKIAKIRRELSKVDQAVTDQINILRNRIDSADREYSRAKREFDAAEIVYKRAKSKMVETREMKNLLSQHLAHILMHTEEEKATRLENLMQQLGLDDGVLASTKPANSNTTTASKTKTKDIKSRKGIAQPNKETKSERSKGWVDPAGKAASGEIAQFSGDTKKENKKTASVSLAARKKAVKEQNFKTGRKSHEKPKRLPEEKGLSHTSEISKPPIIRARRGSRGNTGKKTKGAFKAMDLAGFMQDMNGQSSREFGSTEVANRSRNYHQRSHPSHRRDASGGFAGFEDAGEEHEEEY